MTSKVSFIYSALSFRMNFWYVNIYGLWANIILNIISPLIGILVLNTIVYRYKAWTGGNQNNNIAIIRLSHLTPHTQQSAY